MSKSNSITLLAPQFDDITETKYCKKMTLKAAAGKQECRIYCDAFGFVNIKPPYIEQVYISTRTAYSASEVYFKVEEDQSEQYVSLDKFPADKLVNVFNENLYIKKSQYRYSYRTLDASIVEKITAKLVDVIFPFDKKVTKLTAETIKKVYNEQLANQVWKIKNNDFTPQSIGNLAMLTAGDLVYYDHATHKVVDIFPQDEGSVKIEPIFGGTGRIIELRRDTIYQVPYWTYQKDEMAQLDEELNEQQLLPYMDNDRETYNLYWLPIENAAQYVVTVYKFITFGRYYGRLYQLKRATVDRNTCYFAIGKLLGETYIFRVAAEDREGNIIAQSRGIRQDRHLPQNWSNGI